MPTKSLGFGMAPKSTESLRLENGNRKFTIFAIRLLSRIKTVAEPGAAYLRSDD